MRRIISFVLCVIVMCGCAAPRVSSQSRVMELEQALGAKDALIEEQRLAIERKNKDIETLQSLLAEKDKQLAEKDEVANQLRRRLEGFGVFQ